MIRSLMVIIELILGALVIHQESNNYQWYYTSTLGSVIIYYVVLYHANGPLTRWLDEQRPLERSIVFSKGLRLINELRLWTHSLIHYHIYSASYYTSGDYKRLSNLLAAGMGQYITLNVTVFHKLQVSNNKELKR